MKKVAIAVVSVALGAGALVGIQSIVAATAPAPQLEPQAAHDPSVPSLRPDLGLGERLILVVGGVYPTQAEAEEANAQLHFGEMQGFYVDQIGNFGGLSSSLASRGAWVLASAFRTREGADQFAQLASQAGVENPIVTPRLVSLGGTYVGLGQEAAPDGSGPLTTSIPASRPIQP
jgi:hypothetical protein